MTAAGHGRGSDQAAEAIARVFGADNRARLLTRYFAANVSVTPASAWQHVYRLLLWIDRTTALAHCYESDKAQPGRAWYQRSLAFHDWLAQAFAVAPADLGDVIDWLFREAKVDLAILGDRQRTLVSAKWSIRADREEQFLSDFEAYARLESAGRDFAYTLITNEFDAARLKAACERRRQNGLLFTHVVHINPEGVLAAYGETGRGAALQIRTLIENGRLMDLTTWLGIVIAPVSHE